MLAGVAVSVLLPLSSVVYVFADSSTASALGQFNTAYQRNLTTENGLLATAQSGQSSNAKATALSQTVTLLNQNTASMYATLQAMANNRANLVTITRSTKATGSSAAKKNIEAELKKVESELKNSHHGKKSKQELKQFHQLIKDRNNLQKSLRLLPVNIPNHTSNQWKTHPYSGSIPALEKTILLMQKSSIHYTKMWINVNQQGQTVTSTSTPTTTTGSVYGN